MSPFDALLTSSSHTVVENRSLGSNTIFFGTSFFKLRLFRFLDYCTGMFSLPISPSLLSHTLWSSTVASGSAANVPWSLGMVSRPFPSTLQCPNQTFSFQFGGGSKLGETAGDCSIHFQFFEFKQYVRACYMRRKTWTLFHSLINGYIWNFALADLTSR